MYDGTSWTTHRDIGDASVNDIAFDPSGESWVVTGALYHVKNGTWHMYSMRSEIGIGAHVQAVAFEADGDLWAALGEEGVARFDGDAWHHHPLGGGESSGYFEAIAVGSDGTVWAGSDDGLMRYRDRTWDQVDSVPRIRVSALDVADDGAVWIGTTEGVYIYHEDSWTAMGAGDGLASNQVLSIAIGPDGTAWIVTAGGISRYVPTP